MIYYCKNNFLQWYKEFEASDSEASITNGYILDRCRFSGIITIPDEEYLFFTNFEKPEQSGSGISSVTFQTLKLYDLFDVEIPNALTTLGALVVSILSNPIGPIYNYFYMCTFAVKPGYLGFFRLKFKSYLSNDEYYISNIIRVTDSSMATKSNMIEFYSSRDVGNLPSNVTQYYRLMINAISFEYESNIKQYRQVSDRRLRNIRSYLDKFYTIETYYFDEAGHDAFANILKYMDNIYINGIGLIPKGAYKITGKPSSLISKGVIDMYLSGAILPTYVTNQNPLTFDNDMVTMDNDVIRWDQTIY